MTYIAIPSDDYLAHHGVKGMKWGVRRQRRKEARNQKKERKKVLKRIFSDISGYEKEFDNTSTGKKLKRAYDIARKKYIYNEFPTDDEFNNFHETRSKYHKKQAEYVYDSLTSKYSERDVNDVIYNSYGNISTNKPVRKAFAEARASDTYDDEFDMNL